MEILDFAGPDQWEAWLAEHHAGVAEVWLRIGKKGKPGLKIGDALDVALCFGWIDGQRRAYGDDAFLQRYCPRRARSSWSAINVAKVEALTADGRMRPAGLAEVAKAQADGRWEAAYQGQRTAEVPEDLAAALDADPDAQAAFEKLNRTDRYGIILSLLRSHTPTARDRALKRALDRLQQPD